MILKWTSDPPTQEGWYLFYSQKTYSRNVKSLMLCHYIFKWHGRLYVGSLPTDQHYYDWVCTLRQYIKWYKDAQWAGPLPEPE